MKKTFLSLFTAVTIVSCETPNLDKNNTGIIYTRTGHSIQEITIERCQYIGQFDGSNSDWGTHKGNCNNPIHKQNKVTVVDTVEYKLIRK